MQLVWAGEPNRANNLFEQAKRLSPKYPAWIDWMQGLGQLIAARPDDAVIALQKGIEKAPKSFWPRGRIAAAYAALGRLDKAKAEASEFLKIKPDLTASKFAEMHPFKDPAHRELLRDLLVKAGLPE